MVALQLPIYYYEAMSQTNRLYQSLKIILLIICTGTSALGLIWPFILLSQALSARDPFVLVFSAISFYAWYCYFLMAYAWIKTQTIENQHPIFGTVSALVVLIFNATSRIHKTEVPIREWPLVFTETSFFALPAILMACWLVFFHLKLNPFRSSLKRDI